MWQERPFLSCIVIIYPSITINCKDSESSNKNLPWRPWSEPPKTWIVHLPGYWATCCLEQRTSEGCQRWSRSGHWKEESGMSKRQEKDGSRIASREMQFSFWRLEKLQKSPCFCISNLKQEVDVHVTCLLISFKLIWWTWQRRGCASKVIWSKWPDHLIN